MIQNFFRRIGTVGVLVTSLICFYPIASQAQSTGELRLTTSPLPINLKVAPGSSVSAPIKIKNDGNLNENLKVILMKFKADSDTGVAQLVERGPSDSYFDWVTFSDPTFTLTPNEWKTVTATFNVPSTAAFDYYYAIVFFRADQQVGAGDRQAVLNGGTATLVLLTADVPNAKKQLNLDSFSVDKNIFEFLPATFDVRIRNTGDVHVIPHGNIFISDQGGKDVATLNVNDTQGSILPDSPRDFQSAWSDGFPKYVFKEENGVKTKDSKGNPIQELNWNWADAAKLRWGKYTAKMVMVYDDGRRDVPIEAEASFWVIPWRLIGGSLVILLLVLIGLRSALLNFWNRLRRVSGGKSGTGSGTGQKKK
ncbi:MAG: hypothetical protein HGB37_00880 [Candidatus Moranbacteria bacterium]|nr:hypothetical protein [Candidatus Moranbacteria bacterium]